ncbi:MAG: hypothetical protein WCA16_01295 [Candidatus Sulfotelmatobacter sp.]
MICPIVRSGLRIAVSNPIVREPARSHFDPASHPRAWQGMSYKETFWMACDSVEQLRAEYGPFHTRAEAEVEAKKLGFGYLLRYEHLLDDHEEIEEVRCIFIELPGAIAVESSSAAVASVSLHTRCATCGESSTHEEPWQAEVWADIHEFEHSRHRVRLFEHSRGKGLKEIGGWRG